MESMTQEELSKSSPALRPLKEEVEALEMKRIMEALAASQGVIKDAARQLNLTVRIFSYKLNKYGIRRKFTSD
jgi:Nif-specific regulatory protein